MAGPRRAPRALVPALMLAVVVVGAGVRFYGLGWGLPYPLHTDERVLAVFAERLRTAPSLTDVTDQLYFFLYPPLLFYPLIALVEAVAWVHPFTPTEPAGQTLYYLLARGIAAAFGSATLLLLYWAGSRLYSRATGLLGAALLAVTVLHVRDSHFYCPDVPLTFFLVAVVLAADRLADTGHPRAYLLAGGLAGLAMATKQTALLSWPVIATAHVLATRRPADARVLARRRWRLWALPFLAAAAGGFAFVVADPFPLLNPRRFLQMSLIVRRFVTADVQPHWTFQFTDTTIAYWFTNLLYFGMGPLLALLGVLGLAGAAVKRTRSDLLVLSFVVPYLLVLGPGYMKFIRYAIPLLPWLCLLGARLLVGLWERAARPAARLAVVAAAIAVLGTSLLYTLAYLNVYRQPDARLQAAEWIHRHLPPGATVLVDSSAATPLIGSRFLRPEFYGRTVKEGELHVTVHDHFTVKVLNLLTTPGPPRPSAWWEAYLRERLAGVQYIIMSDEHYEQYRHRADAYPVLDRFYRRLLGGQAGYRLIKTFKTYPALLGYSIDDDRAELTFRLFDHPRIWIFQAER